MSVKDNNDKPDVFDYLLLLVGLTILAVFILIIINGQFRMLIESNNSDIGSGSCRYSDFPGIFILILGMCMVWFPVKKILKSIRK